ncbi:MAG: hypothetical protein GY862_12890 [Gammaproteobacteria bacterium]|nr:hypothetical protein [Gammaproteobacteria bacterium]
MAKSLVQLCNDLRKGFVASSKTNDHGVLDSLTGIEKFFAGKTPSLAEVGTVIALERQLLNLKGMNRQQVEGRVIQVLEGVASSVCVPLPAKEEEEPKEEVKGKKGKKDKKKGKKEKKGKKGKEQKADGGFPVLDEALAESCGSSVEKERCQTALALKKFALEIYAFKKPRDSLTSKRKSWGFGLLTRLADAYDLPEAVETSTEALNTEKPYVILAVLEFLKTSHVAWKREFSSELVENMDKLVEGSKTQDIVEATLDAQVKIGKISASEAESRVANWKKQNGIR